MISWLFPPMMFMASFDLSVTALQFLNAQEHESEFRAIVGDSIPIEANENVVMCVPRLQGHWVLVLIPLPADTVRKELQKLVKEAFGIASENEITVSSNQFRAVDANYPKEPLYGDGFSDFHSVVSTIQAAHEYRILSQRYHQIEKLKGYSESQWRIIDGERIFGKPITLLAITRTDHSSEWARTHTGIPMPFKTSGKTTLVTDTEVNLVESLKSKRPSLTLEYFSPYNGYKTNAVIDMMYAITKAAQSLG